MNSSKRFATIVLAAGIVVLGIAILLGESMGERTLGNANGRTPALPIAITPAPNKSGPSYSSDWKNSQTLSAAADPRFPDPRIPPVPLPTRAPISAKTPTPQPLRTPNSNIPIWDQTTLPSSTPSASASPPSPSNTAEPTSSPSPSAELRRLPCI